MLIDTAHLSGSGDKLQDIPDEVQFFHLNGSESKPASGSDKHV